MMPQAATRQPPAATQRRMLRRVVLMLLACAATATHPLSSHCAESPPLPLLYFLPSSLPSSLSLCLHRGVTQSCVQHGGDPAAELPLLSDQCPPQSCSSCAFPFNWLLCVSLQKRSATKLGNASRFFFILLTSCLHGTSLLETDGEEKE